MKSILMLLFLGLFLEAKEIALTEIIDHVRRYHPHYKALEAESLALDAKIKAEYAREMSRLSAGIADVRTDSGDRASEYSASLAFPIDIAGTRRLDLDSGDLQSEAILLKKQIDLFSFGNRIRNLYHQSCLDLQNLHLHEKSLAAFEDLYRKKRIAYKYSEISKKELLQIELERNLLMQKVKSLKERYKMAKMSLLKLTDMSQEQEPNLRCENLYPILARIEIEKPPFLLSNLAYEKEMTALAKRKDRYSRFSDPVELLLNYDDEIDTKRYGVGVSLPLAFTSARNEQKRIYLMRTQEVRKRQHQAWLLEVDAKRERLYAQLKSSYNEIGALEKNIAKYEQELMPLVEKSFQLGESSVIEYLLGRQKLLDISVTLIERKKRYYQRLFDLYTLIETEK